MAVNKAAQQLISYHVFPIHSNGVINMPWWESSLFWGITGLIGGCLISTIFYFLVKARYLMKYHILTKQIIGDEIANFAGIKIFFYEHSIKELAKTTIRFINSGNQTIMTSDFAFKEPLCIQILGHLYQHNVSAENSNSMPTIIPIDNNKYKIEFDFLKPKQSFTIDVFHSGNVNVLGELRFGDITALNTVSGIILNTILGPTSRMHARVRYRRYYKSRYRTVPDLIIKRILLPTCTLAFTIYLFFTFKFLLFGTIGIICGMVITDLLLFAKEAKHPRNALKRRKDSKKSR